MPVAISCFFEYSFRHKNLPSGCSLLARGSLDEDVHSDGQYESNIPFLEPNLHNMSALYIHIILHCLLILRP